MAKTTQTKKETNRNQNTVDKKDVPAQKQETNNVSSGGRKTNSKGQKIISHPNDVANLVMSQLNTVKTRKDDLESAIKGLADLTTQLVRAYASNAQTIQQMYKKIKELEEAKK